MAFLGLAFGRTDMGWVQALFSNNVGEQIAKPIDALDKLFTSEDEKLSHTEIMQRIKQQPFEAQQLLNQTAAQSTNWFIAGGRPAIMWVCALGLLFFFVINPIIQWITGVVGAPLPVDNIVDLTYGILGIYGTQRTVEKITGRVK